MSKKEKQRQPVSEMLESCKDMVDGLNECQTFTEEEDASKAGEIALLEAWKHGLIMGHYTVKGLNHISACLDTVADTLEELQGKQKDD